MSGPLSTSLLTVYARLSADLVAGGTLVVNYPTGFQYSAGHFTPLGHKAAVVNGAPLLSPRDFTVAFGATAATITLATGAATIPANSEIYFEFNEKGQRGYQDGKTIPKAPIAARISNLQTRELNFGMPLAAVTTTIAAAQLMAGAGNLVLTNTAGVTLDVPRNVTLTVATTDQSARTFTVTGLDEYGNTVVENITGPNANTVQGNKAFKTVTQVAVNGALATNGVSVGFGNKLGLPVFLANAAFILKELQDGASATTGTTVAGVVVKQTATTGDVRGTYVPNTAPDGTKAYSLVVALEDPNFTGGVQFAG